MQLKTMEKRGKSLNELYREFKRWVNSQEERYFVVFDEHIKYNGCPLNRYIIVKGIVKYEFFGDVVIYTIGGEEQLSNPIRCESASDAKRACDRLNAEYVHDKEPELFAHSPQWQEVYEKYFCRINISGAEFANVNKK